MAELRVDEKDAKHPPINPEPEVLPHADPSAIQPAGASPFEQITEMVVNSLHSEHSRRAYRRALEDFIAWYQAQPGRPPLSKALVQDYRKTLTAANWRRPPSTFDSPPSGSWPPRPPTTGCSTPISPPASPK